MTTEYRIAVKAHYITEGGEAFQVYDEGSNAVANLTREAWHAAKIGDVFASVGDASYIDPRIDAIAVYGRELPPSQQHIAP